MARGRPAKCPYCGGSSINKGYRKTKTMGKRRIKLCKDCGRKFTPRNQKSIEDSEGRGQPLEDLLDLLDAQALELDLRAAECVAVVQTPLLEAAA